jgi:hypothetical protein
VTAPFTLAPPGPVKVKVVVLTVAGFIALLKVALMIIPLFGQTPVEAFSGVTEITVGGVVGAPGFPAFPFLSESLHPATRAASRKAEIQVLPNVNLRISCSCSLVTRRSVFLPGGAGIVGIYGFNVLEGVLYRTY